MRRRAFLIGGAGAVAAVTGQPALSQSPPVPGQPLAAGDLAAAAARLRAQFLKDFEPAYVENVIIPHFLVSVYEGERPLLPLIDVTPTILNGPLCPRTFALSVVYRRTALTDLPRNDAPSASRAATPKHAFGS